MSRIRHFYAEANFFYLLATVLVANRGEIWGLKHKNAIDRMRRALGEFRIRGIKTNIAFMDTSEKCFGALVSFVNFCFPVNCEIRECEECRFNDKILQGFGPGRIFVFVWEYIRGVI